MKERKNSAEPLIPSQFPLYPWQIVGTDLFEWKKEVYLLVVDYYSRFIEIALLPSSPSSANTIHRMKSIFARHGIPEIVISDNGPQYSSKEFKEFAREYRFAHQTSSPHFPQSNGEAERAIQTVKKLLKNNQDPYLALLTYRSTPLKNGFSPSELLMSRRLRTHLPAIRKQFMPRVPDRETVREAENYSKEKMKINFDQRHRARELLPLSPGDEVWLPDKKERGRVISETQPRSYTVETPTRMLRRNRRHLNLLPIDQSSQQPFISEGADQGLPFTEPEIDKPISTTITSDVSSGSSFAATTQSESSNVEQSPSSAQDKITTRSGRVVRPPEKLDL
jgi:hypothetical protein